LELDRKKPAEAGCFERNYRGNAVHRGILSVHTEVPLKVNCWVDAGIAPLVEALNEFEDVWTLDSCERDRSDDGQGAYVMFAYRGANAEGFASALRNRIPRSAHLEVDRQPGENEPLLILSCPSDHVDLTAGAVSSARRTR